jgi:hypothetical protein
MPSMQEVISKWIYVEKNVTVKGKVFPALN